VRPSIWEVYTKPKDSYAQWIMAIFSIFSTSVSIVAVYLLNKTLFAEIQPHLIVVPCDEFIELTNEGFKRDGKITNTPFFDVLNAGRSGAIITGMYRTWAVCNGNSVPPVIEYTRTPDLCFYKTNYIPVAAGGHSPSIKGYMKKIEFPIAAENIIYFYGYIEFSDLAGDRYVSGFSLVFDQGRFHTAWPPKDAEKYNYHRKLT
jgi:hypothetical protein